MFEQYMQPMLTLMGIFFILVAVLKIADWQGFVHAFSMYDLIASRSKLYAWLYPWIELYLGILFISKSYILIAAWITLFIMIIGIIGVSKNLFFSKQKVKCACLGTLIPIPLTKFTLFEDLIMAAMALIVILS